MTVAFDNEAWPTGGGGGSSTLEEVLDALFVPLDGSVFGSTANKAAGSVQAGDGDLAIDASGNVTGVLNCETVRDGHNEGPRRVATSIAAFETAHGFPAGSLSGSVPTHSIGLRITINTAEARRVGVGLAVRNTADSRGVGVHAYQSNSSELHAGTSSGTVDGFDNPGADPASCRIQGRISVRPGGSDDGANEAYCVVCMVNTTTGGHLSGIDRSDGGFGTTGEIRLYAIVAATETGVANLNFGVEVAAIPNTLVL